MQKIITIDGAASSGKSFVSRKLSQKMGWRWLSTGVFYRGIAYVGYLEKFQKEKEWLNFIQFGEWEVQLAFQKSLFFYKGRNITEQLYKRKIDELSSLFSGKTIFRKALISFQRDVLKREGALIAEGRDCGTVLFPKAPLKVFLLASSQIRAERRAKDRNSEKADILKDQKIRDRRDKNRHFAPLRKPKGSLVIDTGVHSPEEIVKHIQEKAVPLFQ